MFFAMDPVDLRQITQAIKEGFRDVQISYGGGSDSRRSPRKQEKVRGKTGDEGDIGDDGKASETSTFDYFGQKAEALGSTLKEIVETNKIGAKEIMDSFDEQQKHAKEIYKSFGLTRNYTSEINKSFGESRYNIIEMGGELKDSYIILGEIADTTARSSLATAEAVDDLYALSQILPNIQPTQLIGAFDKVGIGVNRIGEETMSVVKNATSLGLNVGKVSELFVRNLEKANSYNFQGGVQGLARMAATATMFKMDMSTTLSMADKLLSPENAIEMAAGLQRLGVASSDLIDPLRLMDLAQNDPEELQKQVIELSKQFTYFDEKTKTVKILPGAQRTLREIAPLVDMTTQELANLAVQAGTVDDKMSKISFPKTLNVSEEDRMMLTNMAEMNESKTDYVVKFKDESGVMVEKALDQLTKTDLDRIKLEQERISKYDDPKQLALDQMTATDRLTQALEKFKGRIPTEIASSESVEQGVEIIVKTGEATIKTAENILEKIGNKFLGEGQGIADTIDKNISNYLKDGKINFTKLESDFSLLGDKAKDLADQLSTLNLEDVTQFVKDGFLEIGKISTGAFKESLEEVLKTTTPGAIQEALKAMLLEAEKTLIELSKINLGEQKPNEPPNEPPKVVVNTETKEGKDTIINNTIVELYGKDTIDISKEGLTAATDLYGLKERFAEFKEGMLNGMQDVLKTLQQPTTGFKIEDSESKLKLVIEKTSLDLITKELDTTIPKEKNINIIPKIGELEKLSEETFNSVEKNIKPEYIFNFSDKGSLKLINTEIDLLHNNFEKINELAKSFKLNNNFDEVTKDFDGMVEGIKNQKLDINLSTDKLEEQQRKFKDLEENLISLRSVTFNPNIEIPKEKLDLFQKEILNIREELQKNYGTTGFEKALEDAQKKFESLKTETFKISPQIEVDYSKVSKFEILTDENQMKEFKATLDELYKPKKVEIEMDEEKVKELETKLENVRNVYINAKPFLPKEKLEEFENEFKELKANISVNSNIEETEKQIKDFFIEISKDTIHSQEEIQNLIKKTEDSYDTIKALDFKKITNLEDVMKLNPELTKTQAQEIFNEIQEAYKNVAKNINISDLNSLEDTKKALESKAQELDKSLGTIIKKHNLKIDVDYQTNQESVVNVNKTTDNLGKPIETQINYTSKDEDAKKAMESIPKEANVEIKTQATNITETKNQVNEAMDQAKNFEIQPKQFQMEFMPEFDDEGKFKKDIENFQKQINSTPVEILSEESKTKFTTELTRIQGLIKETDFEDVYDSEALSNTLQKLVNQYNEINLKFIPDEKTVENVNKTTEKLTETKDIPLETTIKFTPPKPEEMMGSFNEDVSAELNKLDLESTIKIVPSVGEFEENFNKNENLEKPIVKEVKLDNTKAEESLTKLGTTDFGIKFLSSPLQDYIQSLQTNAIKIPLEADTSKLQSEVDMKVKPTIETNSNLKGSEPVEEKTEFKPISSVNLPEIIIQESKPENLMTTAPIIETRPTTIPTPEPEIKVQSPESITGPLNRMENITTTNSTNNIKVEGSANMNHTINFSGIPPGVDSTMFKSMMIEYMNSPENAKMLAKSMTDMSLGYGTIGRTSFMGDNNKNLV